MQLTNTSPETSTIPIFPDRLLGRSGSRQGHIFCDCRQGGCIRLSSLVKHHRRSAVPGRNLKPKCMDSNDYGYSHGNSDRRYPADRHRKKLRLASEKHRKCHDYGLSGRLDGRSRVSLAIGSDNSVCGVYAGFVPHSRQYDMGWFVYLPINCKNRRKMLCH